MLSTKIKTTKYKYGEISYLSDDMYIGKSLKLYGDYCEDEPELWRKIIDPGCVAIDVGANIGALSLPLARMVGPVGRVIAYEAQQQNYDLLCRNVEQNEITNIDTEHVALGSVSGVTHVPSYDELGHTNYGRVVTGTGSEEVARTTLDICLEDVADIKFIKIDVEGDELEVLRGARETIECHRPVLYVENDRPEKSGELLGFIRSLNYRIYDHLVPLYKENNWKNNKTNLFENLYAINVLCIPAEHTDKYRHLTDHMSAVVPASPKVGKTGWAGIARFGGIGDNLIAASVLKPLKAMGYKIDVITQEPQSCVFENNPYIDKLSLKVPARDLPQNNMQAWQDWFTSRSYEYDLFVNLSHSCEGMLACFPAMTYFTWPPQFRRKQFGGNYLETVHDVVGVPYDFGPLFFSTQEEIDKAFETKRKLNGRKVIGWCLSGTRFDKLYPGSPMAIARLIKELEVDVVMFGAPPPSRDHAAAAHIQEHVKQQNGSDYGLFEAISTEKGQWPIRRVLTFATICDLIISPDTGPAWAVAFEPMPKIVLHSHASVHNITAHWQNAVSLSPEQSVKCWPCHLLHDYIDTCLAEQVKCGVAVNPEHKDKGIAACISSISVESIINAARAALSQPQG